MKMQKKCTTKDLRFFGFLLAAFLALVGIWPALFRHQPARIWVLAAAALPLLIAVLRPSVLAWPCRGWLSIGNIIGGVVTRIVLGAIFFLMFTPVGLIRRILKRDTLSLRYDAGADSYRIAVNLNDIQSMDRQY
ncbi:MAG: SxtJ family membrane protein [Pseudomonadota bacterium]